MQRSPAIFQLCLALVLGLPAAHAADVPPPADAHRYLFVVDTSRTMKSQLDNTISLVGYLIHKGMDGRMRAGDTVGLWTFNSELSTGEFPMKIWQPQRAQTLSMSAMSFIEARDFARSTNLEKPVKAALALLKDSQAITIVFVTHGGARIKGTPYDEEINSTFKKHGKAMSTNHVPCIFMLSGRDGSLVGYSVNSPSQALNYPPNEKPQPAAPPPKAPKAAEPGKVLQPAVVVPPFIVTGRKAPSETNPVPSAALVAPPSASTQTITNEVVAFIPTNAPLKVSEKGSLVLPQPVIIAAPTPPATTTTTTIQPKPAASGITAGQSAALIAAPAPGEVKSTPAPVAASVAKPPPPAITTQVVAHVAPTPPAAPTNSPAPLIAVIPPEANYSSRSLLIAAFTLLGVAVVLMIFLVRRRPPQRVSAITRSLDRDRNEP